MSDEPRRTIRITVPVSVAYNLKAFQKSLVNLGELLGCRACFSGADCLFTLEKDYLIDPEGAVRLGSSLSAPTSASSTAFLADKTATRAVVTLSGNSSRDISILQKSVAGIAERLGCAPCTSGFDLLFKRDLATLRDRAFKVSANGALG